MAIPSSLIKKCEINEFVWHREDPSEVDAAFEELMLKKNGEIYEFCREYCLQFVSKTIPFQLVDIIEDDGISDNVFYARDELGIDPQLLPISPYEAESIYVVDTGDDRVLMLTANEADDGWNAEIISNSFYAFMLKHLD